MPGQIQKHHAESGNALLFIFIAIGLLAALSFSISQGNQGSTEVLNEDRQRLIATEIIDYGGAVAEAVTQIRLRGTQLKDLRFSHPDVSETDYGEYGDSPRNEVFHPEGGGILYKLPLADALENPPGQYHFHHRNQVEQVGSTCGAERCSDLIMVAEGLRKGTCMAINTQLGIENPNKEPPVESDIETSGVFKGEFGFAERIGDDDEVLAGKTEACVHETSEDQYVYYKVLIAR
jgi:hypothetical protein